MPTNNKYTHHGGYDGRKEGIIMNVFVEKMENVKNGQFTIDGKLWECVKNSNGNPVMGTSPRGLWNLMTNGDESKYIYKDDVYKYDHKKANALFN